MNKFTLGGGNRQLCAPPDVPEGWVGAGVACCCDNNDDSCVELQPGKCCIGDDCNQMAARCEAGFVATWDGCDADCEPVFLGCLPVGGDCVLNPGAECCLGDRCISESPDCDSGMSAEFYGCDEDCMPDWGPCEIIEIGDDFKTCTAPAQFGCMPITQGAEPPEGTEPTEVCGCIPECPGQFLIAQAVSSAWPDGSQKGSFFCADSLPPGDDAAGGPLYMCGDGECQDWELTESHPGYCPDDC